MRRYWNHLFEIFKKERKERNINWCNGVKLFKVYLCCWQRDINIHFHVPGSGCCQRHAQSSFVTLRSNDTQAAVMLSKRLLATNTKEWYSFHRGSLLSCIYFDIFVHIICLQMFHPCSFLFIWYVHWLATKAFAHMKYIICSKGTKRKKNARLSTKHLLRRRHFSDSEPLLQSNNTEIEWLWWWRRICDYRTGLSVIKYSNKRVKYEAFTGLRLLKIVLTSRKKEIQYVQNALKLLAKPNSTPYFCFI